MSTRKEENRKDGGLVIFKTIFVGALMTFLSILAIFSRTRKTTESFRIRLVDLTLTKGQDSSDTVVTNATMITAKVSKCLVISFHAMIPVRGPYTTQYRCF